MKAAHVLMLAMAGAVPLSAAAQPMGVLRVEISNIRNAKGNVHIDICPEAKFLKDDCPYSATVPSQIDTTILTAHLPAGRYAVQAFHDENANGEVDRVLFGIPKEGVGFSNDAKIGLGPPKFAEAAFAFDGHRQTIALKMRYFVGPTGPKKH